MRVTAHNRQSILDLALQECGSFEAAYALSARNGIGLTDELSAGQQLEYTADEVTHKQAVISLAAAGICPATAISPQDTELAPYAGIGYMGIEIDFIIS